MCQLLLRFGLLGITALTSFSVIGQFSTPSVKLSAISEEDAKRCGMNISTPDMTDIYGKPLHFDCTANGQIKGNDFRIATMDFQYDPNSRRVSNNITFYVGGVKLSKAKKLLSSDFFALNDGETIDQFSGKAIHRRDKTYCGLVVTTKVKPIRGSNWTGWIAEDSYNGLPHPSCASPEEYTSRYRCVSLIVGNENMSAAMSQACLLRKSEDNIQVGLSYDVFIEMAKTIRFNEGHIFEN